MLKLIATILFASSQLWAAELLPEELPENLGGSPSKDCTPVDLRTELDPIRLQGEAELCFAYSASDLVKQRTGLAVSALDLAMQFFFNDSRELKKNQDPQLKRYLAAHPDFEDDIESYREAVDISTESGNKERIPMFHHLEGGHEVPTFLLANLKGLCEESSFPSANGYEAHSAWIKALEKAAKERSQTAGPEVDVFDKRFREPVADIFNTGWLRYSAKTCHRVKSPVPLIPVTYPLADNLKDFEEKVKSGKIGPRERRRYLGALNFALSHHRLAAVGYDLNSYVDQNSTRFLKRTPEEVDQDGDHSSTIVARRPAGRHCEYLVRDTSGYECQEYLPPYRDRCENHHFWLTEGELGAHFYDIVYLR